MAGVVVAFTILVPEEGEVDVRNFFKLQSRDISFAPTIKLKEWKSLGKVRYGVTYRKIPGSQSYAPLLVRSHRYRHEPLYFHISY
jgi:hypothetical protein